MDVLFSDDEAMIKQAAATFLGERSTSATIRAAEASREKFSSDLWSGVAELGWCGLCLPEDCGGQGAPLGLLGLLLEEVGRHIAPIPLATSSAAALTVAKFGGRAHRDLLSAVAVGKRVLGYALQEADGVWNADSISTIASVEGDTLVLRGKKFFVEGMAAADHLLVAFRNAESGALGLGLVDVRSRGLGAARLVNTAKGDQSVVSLDGVKLPVGNLIGDWVTGRDAVDHLMSLAAAFTAAQLAGAARRVTEMAVEYSRIRFAFGQPIGSFQSLQHMSADMIIAVDGSELLVREALWRLGSGRSAQLEVSQAKAFANIHCVSTCRSAQQIHGGMGFMMEFDLNLWYRRVVSWSLCSGTVYEHRRVVSGLLLEQSEHMRLDDCHPVERSGAQTLAA